MTLTKIVEADLKAVFDQCNESLFIKNGKDITDMEVFFRWCPSATETFKLKNVRWQGESFMHEDHVPLETEVCREFI